MTVEAFHYRLPTRTRSPQPGAHPGTQRGGGMEFRGHAPLLSAPDPRRFDVAAGLRDPFGRLMVRIYTQRGAIPVRVLADLSASMSFPDDGRKMGVLADFMESLALSAYRRGDPLAFTGCDSVVREELSVPLTRSRAAGTVIAAKLREFSPTGRDCHGLFQAVERMSARRSLVFLVSDFHFSLSTLAGLLERLALHAVVPVVLWDDEEARTPRSGFARVYDPETGAGRLLLFRRSLARRLQQGVAARAQALRECCTRFGVTPLFLRDRFEADAVTRYFYG